MLSKKIPLLYLAVSALIASVATLFAFKSYNGGLNYNFYEDNDHSVSKAGPVECKPQIARLAGYTFTHPLLSSEPECESNRFIHLKASILNFIERQQDDNQISAASVYIKDISSNEWVNINSRISYHPGSLFKLVTLITYLRMAETDKGLLKREISYQQTGAIPHQTFNSKTITPGNKYTIEQLLHYMIAYSDNNATLLLNQNMNITIFENIFTDLGLQKPNVHDRSYVISARDYSRFLMILYNAVYLSVSNSEYAISLLCECDFKDGIAKELPDDIKIAHKFGQAKESDLIELHESAIVYLKDKPYLLTVMTKGTDVSKLAGTISSISKMVYERMSAN
jgi:beta-lactamase class A